MSNIRKILVAVDISKYAESLVCYGCRLARSFDAEVLIALVVDQRVVDALQMVIKKHEGLSAAAVIEDKERQYTEQLHAFVASAGCAQMNVRPFVRRGVPFREILALIDEERPDLLIMGTKGRTNLADVIVGSCAERLYRRSPIPVLTLPADALSKTIKTPIRTILVACDLSPKTTATLSYAFDLAEKFAARLIILHVIDARDVTAIEHAYGRIAETSHTEDLQAYLQEHHHETALDLRERIPSNRRKQKNYRLLTREGQPHVHIVSEAKRREAELVVIGEGRHGYLMDRLVGSTAGRLLRLLPIPMMSLRGAIYLPDSKIIV